MPERTGIGWRGLALSIVLAAVALGSTSTASAVIYAPVPPVIYEPAPASPPPFCTPVTVSNLLEPLAHLPKLHAPPASGRVGFAPASLRLQPLPALVIDEGRVGYELSLNRHAPAFHPGWTVTTTLVRIDSRGRPIKTIDRVRRHLKTINARRGAGVKFEVEGASSLYRVITVFRSKSGKRLARYGFYFRLVPTTSNARLGLDAGSYRVGDTVFGRIENFGTLPVTYGAQFTIEQLEGASWSRIPQSPRAFPLVSYTAEPGKSGPGCAQFRIRQTMEPGHYRMAKEVDIETVPQLRSEHATLYAEFDVLP
jgi:hypothetical protein